MWGRGWGGVGHVNVPCTLHTLLHTVLSPIVSELVFQCAWRQHQGPVSPTQFFTALQRLLKHCKLWDETKIRRWSLKCQCELQKVTETPRPSVRRVPCSCSCLSVCLSIYLFIYLSIRLSLCLPAWLSSNLSVYLSICISASLKTKLFCETSSLFALDNIKNAAILQDFFNVLT